MPLLVLSLGSNTEPASNLHQAMGALRRKFGRPRLSPVYESEAVGFTGANFLNLVAAFESDEALTDISRFLKDLENQAGRDRSQPKFSSRTLDVDVLLYGDHSGAECGLQLPRAEITRHAFVLRPLADLLPELRHSSGRSYGELWRDFADDGQRLWPIEFDWEPD